MKITHSGSFPVKMDRQQVFKFLTAPERFAPLLPGFKSVEVDKDGSVRIKVKVGVSHIKGTALVKLRLTENQPPIRAGYQGMGSLLGGAVNIGSRFDLEVTDQTTLVKWQGEASVFGRLTSMARGLLDPLARKNIQLFIDALDQALNGGSSG